MTAVLAITGSPEACIGNSITVSLQAMERVAQRIACNSGDMWPDLTERQRNELLWLAYEALSNAARFINTVRRYWRGGPPILSIDTWDQADTVLWWVGDFRITFLARFPEARHYEAMLSGGERR